MQATQKELKFLSKVKLINLYNQPFDIIEVYTDGKETYQTQYGYNIRILRILYFLKNKLVHRLQPEDSTMTIKYQPKI